MHCSGRASSQGGGGAGAGGEVTGSSFGASAVYVRWFVYRRAV